MEIAVREILLGNQVKVTSDWGDFVGTWSDTEKPLLKKYHVELDVSQILDFSTMQKSDAAKVMIQSVDDKIRIAGQVCEYEDQVLYIRIGKDLLMIETKEDNRFQSLVNQFVQMTVDQICIYDTGILIEGVTENGLP